MSMESPSDTVDSLPGTIAKPPGTKEFTLRAVLAAIVVAAIMGAAYPYVVLKLGFGPNVSVVAAFLGYLALGLAFRNYNRWENNIVQTAGTSAAQTAFMCVILAAFDLLKQSKVLGYTFSPTPFQSFVWLAVGSILGLLLAVPLRRHYVVDEKLTYADGVAAAETIIVLDSRGKEARNPALFLLAGTVISGIVLFLTLPWGGHVLPEVVLATTFGLTAANSGSGLAVSALGIGSGMIVGLRITVSMAIGATLSWIIAPQLLVPAGIVATAARSDILRWTMWPGTAMIIFGGLTALFLKWRTLARSFSTLSRGVADTQEFPLRWVGIGVTVSSLAMIFIQMWIFDLPWWITLVSVALSVPLMLVGLRVLGETNWGPISQLTNLMQAIFAGLAPGNITTNLATSGTTGTIAVTSEAIMQDYKAGHLIGSTPRYLTYAQLMAAPIGAAAVAWMYPLLRDTYGIGGNGLSSPISQRVASFAEFLTTGGAAMPRWAMEAALLFGVLGILTAVLETTKVKRWLPSASAVGIGMVVPGSIIFTMVLGGLLQALWVSRSPKTEARYSAPLASGLIAGEALVAVVIPLLIAIGLLSPAG
jgi:uncharacterized oligopeptide transporter (OPT) family protein